MNWNTLSKWLSSPATILALVPFITFLLEWVYRKLFGQETEEALLIATQKDTREGIKTCKCLLDETLRPALAVYVNTRGQLKEFYKTMTLVGLSLFAWFLSNLGARKLHLIIWVLLLATAFFATIWVSVQLHRQRYEWGNPGSTSKAFRAALGMSFTLMVFDLFTKATATQ